MRDVLVPLVIAESVVCIAMALAIVVILGALA
jgi:hypothetical protein